MQNHNEPHSTARSATTTEKTHSLHWLRLAETDCVTNIWIMPIWSCQFVSPPSRRVTAAPAVGVQVRRVGEGLPKNLKSMMQWVIGCPSTAGAEVGLRHGNQALDRVGSAGAGSEWQQRVDSWVTVLPPIHDHPCSHRSLFTFRF